MKHFIVVFNSICDGEINFKIIAVTHSPEKAKEIFKNRVKFERRNIKGDEWVIDEDTDIRFDAYIDEDDEEGECGYQDCVTLYIEEINSNE